MPRPQRRSKPPVRLNAKPTKPHSTKKGARGYDRKAAAAVLREEFASESDSIGGTKLDDSERLALRHFAQLFKEARTDGRQELDLRRLSRSAEGHILVPVTLPGRDPDFSLAMLMEHKAEQVYKQTGCRFLLVQRPTKHPSRHALVWTDGAWRVVP